MWLMDLTAGGPASEEDERIAATAEKFDSGGGDPLFRPRPGLGPTGPRRQQGSRVSLRRLEDVFLDRHTGGRGTASSHLVRCTEVY